MEHYLPSPLKVTVLIWLVLPVSELYINALSKFFVQIHLLTLYFWEPSVSLHNNHSHNLFIFIALKNSIVQIYYSWCTYCVWTAMLFSTFRYYNKERIYNKWIFCTHLLWAYVHISAVPIFRGRNSESGVMHMFTLNR